MMSLAPILSLLLAIASPAAGLSARAGEGEEAGLALSYDRPLGQVARYHLSLDAQGELESLGERLPVRWKAEFGLAEEVVAKRTDGTLWLRVPARLVEVRDAAGTLAGAIPAKWPVVQVELSPRGELIDVSLAIGEPDPGPRERGFTALMVQPSPIVLPDRRVQVGDEWKYERGSAHQANRLVSLTEVGGDTVAHIASTASSPLSLEEASPALGLTTLLTGQVRQRSQMDLLVGRGLVQRHTGEMQVETKSEVALLLPEGTQGFEMASNLTIAFDLQLLSIDGQPAGGR